jgi:hypothetical protein
MAGAGRHIFGRTHRRTRLFRAPIGSYTNLVAADPGWLAARARPALMLRAE